MAGVTFSFMLLVLTGLPVVLGALPFLFLPSIAARLAWLFVAPLMLSAAFVAVAALLARPYVSAIVPGTFPRDLTNPAYRRRRLYGLCWTAVYYCKPVYWLFLSVPALKEILFRAFGYRGHPDFTIYPDCWVRDLPLLDFGAGAYISNRATLGTNVVLQNGTILVDGITLGRKALVGHLAMVGPGCRLDDGAEIGPGAVLGVRSRLGRNCKVKGACSISHGVVLEDGCDVGGHSVIGLRAIVRAGISLPEGTVIPAGAVIADQAQVEEHVAAERLRLASARVGIAKILKR